MNEAFRQSMRKLKEDIKKKRQAIKNESIAYVFLEGEIHILDKEHEDGFELMRGEYFTIEEILIACCPVGEFSCCEWLFYIPEINHAYRENPNCVKNVDLIRAWVQKAKTHKLAHQVQWP